MLNDYKGEKPNNVITEEEHKKRPFYKKVSFWVLSALGLFFGGCSVYGLVLGYQYVHAVTEAAHIIADANSSDDTAGLKKERFHAFNAGVEVACVNLGDLQWSYTPNAVHPYFSASLDYAPLGVQGVVPDYLCSLYNAHVRAQTAGDSVPNAYDMSSAIFFQQGGVIINNPDYTDVASFATGMQGVYLYYKTTSDYTGAGAYETGFGNGYDQGYQEGYDQGLADGAQNLDQNQTVILRGTHPSINDLYHTFNYSVTINGAAVYTGTLTGNQTFSFSRAVGDLVAVDISPTETLESRYSLSASCNVGFWTVEYPEPSTGLPVYKQFIHDGYFYLPTNYRQVFINLEGFVSVGGAPFGLAIPTTFALTRDGNVYSQFGYYSYGYNAGYSDGLTAGDNYQSGKEDGLREGYDQGYEDGKTIGIAQGEAQAVGGQKALVNMFVTAFQQPFDQIYRFLNFNVLGLNVLALFTSLLTLSIGIIIIKKVI